MRSVKHQFIDFYPITLDQKYRSQKIHKPLLQPQEGNVSIQ